MRIGDKVFNIDGEVKGEVVGIHIRLLSADKITIKTEEGEFKFKKKDLKLSPETPIIINDPPIRHNFLGPGAGGASGAI